MSEAIEPPPFAVAARGAALVGIVQAVLVGGLAVFGAVRSTLGGAGVLGSAGSILLLAIFTAGLLRHRRGAVPTRPGWAFVLLGLGAGLVLVSPHFVWLQFPLWLVAAQALPLPQALPATAASLAVTISVLLRQNSTSASVIGPIIGALVAVGISRGTLLLQAEARRSRELLARVVAAQEEASVLSDEVVRAQREAGVLQERTRLARDIHDTLAQGFSSIVLLARAAQLTTDPSATRDLIDQIESTASDNLGEARRVVYALDPPGLVSGLAIPLRRFADDLTRQTGAEVTIEIDEDLPRLPAADEVILLRAVQGALANTRLHARASHVAIQVSVADGAVRLDVVDDGVGFDQTEVSRTPTLAGGYGLGALRLRLREAGGGLAIDSEIGSGTAVSAWLPLRSAS